MQNWHAQRIDQKNENKYAKKKIETNLETKNDNRNNLIGKDTIIAGEWFNFVFIKQLYGMHNLFVFQIFPIFSL